MGVDPVTIGLGVAAGGQVLGAISGDRANARNQRAQTAWQNKIFGQGQSLMGQGQDYGPEIQKFLSTLQGTGPNQFTGEGDINLDSLFSGTGFNAGNDALNQVIRGGTDKGADSYLQSLVAGGGNPFDTSDMFKALGAQDEQNLTRSTAQLRGGAGSLGQRFGSALADRESALRATDLTNRGARNAGIQQASYEAGQGRAMGAAQELNSNILNLLGIKTQAGQALNAAGQNEAGLRLQGQEFNRTNAQSIFGMNQDAANQRIAQILQGLGLGAQSADAMNRYRAGIFGTMAGGPGPGQYQGSQVPGAFSDAGIYALLNSQLGKKSYNLPNDPTPPGGFVLH